MLARSNFEELDVEGVQANVASTASSRSPEVGSYGVSSLKAPILPSKAYVAVDHTGEALHTMAVLQTYQVDLLKDLDQGED